MYEPRWPNGLARPSTNPKVEVSNLGQFLFLFFFFFQFLFISFIIIFFVVSVPPPPFCVCAEILLDLYRDRLQLEPIEQMTPDKRHTLTSYVLCVLDAFFSESQAHENNQ